MTGIVDWAASRARMVMAFIVLSLAAGALAYTGLPKEGEPDIEIPALFISVPFPGISAEDSEKLLVRVIEAEMSDLDGLTKMSSTAAENYAGVALEFEFGWDKSAVIADVRDAMSTAEAQFPDGADKYSINEINFSEFPILIVNMSGDLPERELLRYAQDLQDAVEGLDAVLEAPLAGHRDEMLEVIIDPLRLEAYDITALELIQVVQNNNQLIAAGELESETGAFGLKIPSSFDEERDIFNLVVKDNGESQVTLGDIADIRLTFEDRVGTARFNGENTVALQVVKRRGFNIIDTSAVVMQTVEEVRNSWPEEVQRAISVGVSNDQSRNVASMVSQLEGSVLTAIFLVMIVVLGALGIRPALLVGFAIPTSFLLCFVLLGLMDITISNIVMFGLILAVGMLVDGAIVVVEYADKRIREGIGPMHAYVEAAKRMFWPVVSSTATTLCAFLPMLFWPGVPGQFMGMLPVTLIFVLTASLIVALVYLPVLGGVTGRLSRALGAVSEAMRSALPWIVNAAFVLPAMYLLFIGAMQMLNPGYLLSPAPQGALGPALGALIFVFGAFATSITTGAARIERKKSRIRAGYRRNLFGGFIRFLTGNPIMPIVTIIGVMFFVMTVFTYFDQNSKGVEFFVETEPEQSIIYVRQRGNMSLTEKDALVQQAEEIALTVDGIDSVFAFAGEGGLDNNTGGASAPRDTIGQLQIEMIPWEQRPRTTEWRTTLWGILPYPVTNVDPYYDGDAVMERLEIALADIPGVQTEILNLSRGPASAKPVHLRIFSNDWNALQDATRMVRDQFDQTYGLNGVDDTLPLPGIDWQIDVDVERAGQYGADVATVGGMVQLVTRGLFLDTMRVENSDDEIEIRVRLPEDQRLLSTLETLKLRTRDGLIPLTNFITITPTAQLAQIDRFDQSRYFDIRAGVDSGLTVEVTDEDGTIRQVPLTPSERIEFLTAWLEEEANLPDGVTWEWTGDQEEQAESQAFLGQAFLGALGLMFIILLAQFNSIYNAFLVLTAVVLSTTGVLIGMIVMDQAFSIIMTGTGIVALAGIVVNNNIVLIDTYQEYSRYMPRIEAITRTAQARIRPVLLTTITTMAGLAPMMFGLSLDFIGGGYSIDSPTSLWWKQLATAVVFGLGVATVLTLVFTPSMLALRVWFGTYVNWLARLLAALSFGRRSRAARDMSLRRAARQMRTVELVWEDDPIVQQSDVEDRDEQSDEQSDEPPIDLDNPHEPPSPDTTPPPSEEQSDEPVKPQFDDRALRTSDGPDETPENTPIKTAE